MELIKIDTIELKENLNGDIKKFIDDLNRYVRMQKTIGEEKKNKID